MKVVLASANTGKLTELSALLGPLGMTLVTQADLGVESIPETATSFVENALIKARHASRETGLPAIADDSGITADALSGAPGIYSARYAGPDASDADNNAKLLAALDQHSDRRAHYDCVMVFLRNPDDPTPLIGSGRWSGTIVSTAAGSNGFGYDPYFFVEAFGVTAAQLDPQLKNQISHRGQAARALSEQMRDLAGSASASQ